MAKTLDIARIIHIVSHVVADNSSEVSKHSTDDGLAAAIMNRVLGQYTTQEIEEALEREFNK